MANDILALSDDQGVPETPVATTVPSMPPQPVPELGGDGAMVLTFNGSLIAPDFFTSSRGKSSKSSKSSKSKKHYWKLTRS
jgi:hypothetical protein